MKRMRVYLTAFLVLTCLLFTAELSAEWVDYDGTGLESINFHDTANRSESQTMVLDSAGNPHIIWPEKTTGNYYINYLKWNGSEWVDIDGTGQESITIVNDMGDLAYVSLCLDSADRPHIAWADGPMADKRVYYKRWNGSSWVDADGTGLESISIFGSMGFYQVLRLDPSDRPYIAFVGLYLSNYETLYLKWNGSSWVDVDGAGQESIVVPGGGIDSALCTFCLDGSQFPHVLWQNDSSGNYQIYYLKWNGTEWVDADGAGRESISVLNNNDNCMGPNMTLDGSGMPHIVWTGYVHSFEVNYLMWNSEWTDADGAGRESVVISNVGCISSDTPQICFDSSGKQHVAWSGMTGMNYNIYYLKRIGNSWVDADGTGQENPIVPIANTIKFGVSLEIDNLLNPHIAYIDATYCPDRDIFYVKWIMNGTPTEVVTATASPTATLTGTPTCTRTSTASYTASLTATGTITVSPTLTISATYTVTPYYSATFTVTKTSTVTLTPYISPTATLTMTPTALPRVPLQLILKGNYPDPFKADTQIVFWLSKDADVNVKIYDISAEKVLETAVFEGYMGNNSFCWNGKNTKNMVTASAVYIYKVEAKAEGEKVWDWSKCAVAK